MAAEGMRLLTDNGQLKQTDRQRQTTDCFEIATCPKVADGTAERYGGRHGLRSAWQVSRLQSLRSGGGSQKYSGNQAGRVSLLRGQSVTCDQREYKQAQSIKHRILQQAVGEAR